MNSIEQAYWKHIASMSGQERVARTLALFDSVTMMIASKIRRTHPDAEGQELNRQIAMQLYRRDPDVQTLLREYDL